MSSKTLYVLYNADASILGKLRYGYRKLSCPSDSTESPCAACDITHGGLSLSETPQWKEVKQHIQNQHVTVVQWHRDEIDSKMKDIITKTGLRYPAIVLDNGQGRLETVMDSAELNKCGGNPQVFLDVLSEKRVLAEQKPINSSL